MANPWCFAGGITTPRPTSPSSARGTTTRAWRGGLNRNRCPVDRQSENLERYVYVGNDRVNFVDPKGLFEFSLSNFFTIVGGEAAIIGDACAIATFGTCAGAAGIVAGGAAIGAALTS